MSSCCPPGSWPALEPQGASGGTVTDIGDGVLAYVSTPSESNQMAIISCQDIFAYDSARHFQCVDQFAAMGFTVVHVDFTGDNYVKDMSEIVKWIHEFQYKDKIRSKMEVAASYIKKQGIEKIAAVGYCWGCYNIFHACADDAAISSLIQAGVLFHPSIRLNEMLGGPADCTTDLCPKITTPLLLVACENDPDFVKPGGSTIETLVKTSPKSKAVLMEDMQHGFVNRGDVGDEKVKESVKKAIEMAVDFIKDQLK